MADVILYIYSRNEDKYYYTKSCNLTFIPRVNEEIQYDFYGEVILVVDRIVHDIKHNNVCIYAKEKIYDDKLI